MKNINKLFFILLFPLCFISSVYANDRIYTMEEVIKKDGYAYDKRSNELIYGIVIIYNDSGELRKEISLKGGVRHGA